MNKFFHILIILSTVIFLSSCSKIKYETAAVPQAVKNYLHENGTDFIHYELSKTDDKDYNYIEQSFIVYEEIETLWLDYMKSILILEFDSRIIDFGVFFDPESSLIYSAQDPSPPSFSEGQIYILNLIFMGIYKFPIAFEISKIDSDNKMIVFTYLKNNLATGYQQIYFKSDYNSEGVPITHIDHNTYFKSQNGIIDNFLYPPFHRQTINDYHENIFKLNGLSWEIP
jgi:hypothetical protein